VLPTLGFSAKSVLSSLLLITGVCFQMILLELRRLIRAEMGHSFDFRSEPIKILDNCSLNELSFGVDTKTIRQTLNFRGQNEYERPIH
jgi:hypothetical protein